MHEGNLKSWFIWLVASLFYFYEFIHRVALSVMMPELAEYFNASNAMIGTLSACYFYAYASAQIPVGMLIDEYGTRKNLTLACLIIALASFMFAFTTKIWFANIARILIGFASAFAFSGCLKLSATWFPAHRFAFIVGLTNLMGIIGAIVGVNLLANEINNLGWQNILLWSGVIGLVLTGLLWVVVKDGVANKPSKRKTHNLYSIIEHLLLVARLPQIWLIAFFAGCIVAPITTYAELWGVTYLMDSYKLTRSDAANINSIIFLGIALGGPTIGWISDYFRQRKIPLLVGLIGAACAFLTIISSNSLSIYTLYLLHFMFGFCSSSMLLCFTMNSELTTDNARATTIAVTNTVIMGMGALLQTLCSMILNDNMNYLHGLLPLIICYGLAFLCFYFICEPGCCFKEDES